MPINIPAASHVKEEGINHFLDRRHVQHVPVGNTITWREEQQINVKIVLQVGMRLARETQDVPNAKEEGINQV